MSNDLELVEKRQFQSLPIIAATARPPMRPRIDRKPARPKQIFKPFEQRANEETPAAYLARIAPRTRAVEEISRYTSLIALNLTLREIQSVESADTETQTAFLKRLGKKVAELTEDVVRETLRQIQEEVRKCIVDQFTAVAVNEYQGNHCAQAAISQRENVAKIVGKSSDGNWCESVVSPDDKYSHFTLSECINVTTRNVETIRAFENENEIDMERLVFETLTPRVYRAEELSRTLP